MSTVTHDTTYRIRYSDTDTMGVVYYGNYMRLFEIGRTELLRAAGIAYASFEAEGLFLPVLEAHAEYHAPAKYDDEVVITTRYTPTPTAALILSYSVHRNGDTLVTGWTRHTFVSAETFRPVRPPRRFIEGIERFLHQNHSL
jgi:acyl-CoA thioester hydrolase